MKKFLPIILAMLMLAGCADNGGTAEVEETSGTVASESAETAATVTSGEISETTTTTTTTETTETTTAADTEKIPAEVNWDSYVLVGERNEKAVYLSRGECFFKDENGEITPLGNGTPYYLMYKLSKDIIVCQPVGNTAPCDVYVMTDGKPVLDEKISGHGMLLSQSELNGDGFELTESGYDSGAFWHTYKPYQFYRDGDGFHEYGSITVPMEDFNKYYSEAAGKVLDEFQAEKNVGGLEIYEVMYRGDGCFILNCQSPVFCDEGDETPFAYRFYNFTLKPADGKFSLVFWERGIYKTALIPEIAVYPEEMYIPE